MIRSIGQKRGSTGSPRTGSWFRCWRSYPHQAKPGGTWVAPPCDSRPCTPALPARDAWNFDGDPWNPGGDPWNPGGEAHPSRVRGKTGPWAAWRVPRTDADGIGCDPKRLVHECRQPGPPAEKCVRARRARSCTRLLNPAHALRRPCARVFSTRAWDSAPCAQARAGRNPGSGLRRMYISGRGSPCIDGSQPAQWSPCMATPCARGAARALPGLFPVLGHLNQGRSEQPDSVGGELVVSGSGQVSRRAMVRFRLEKRGSTGSPRTGSDGFVVRCSLFVARCSLLVACCSLLATRCPLPVARYSLLVAHGPRFAVSGSPLP